MSEQLRQTEAKRLDDRTLRAPSKTVQQNAVLASRDRQRWPSIAMIRTRRPCATVTARENLTASLAKALQHELKRIARFTVVHWLTSRATA